MITAILILVLAIVVAKTNRSAMRRRICASLLSLCSLIGGAERKSDASIIGKTLKYGSAAVAATAHLAAFVISAKLYKNKNFMDNFSGPLLAKGIPYVGNYLEVNFYYKAIGALNLLPIWLIDSPCLNAYTLGKCLDGDFNKSNANQEEKSLKETVSDKNKISKPEDKSQNSNENSKKSKI